CGGEQGAFPLEKLRISTSHKSTMNTQPSIGSEPSTDPPASPELRLQDLPALPALANEDPGYGPLVEAQFLVYYLTPDVQRNWVRRNRFECRCSVSYQVLVAIVKQTSSCYLSYVERDNIFGQCPALFIASNETPEDLKRAQNFDLIKEAANILQTNKPPVWRRPALI
ncbi:hypothetical protein H0H92_010498, partial [Tricholoma furcatifolium]